MMRLPDTALWKEDGKKWRTTEVKGERKEVEADNN